MIHVEHLGHSSLAGTSQTFALDRVRIGRRPENEIAFDPQADLLVSGLHAEVRLEGGRPVVVDLGSSNGTWVNGRQISRPVALEPGDVVALGNNGPTLRIRSDRGAAPSPVASSGRGGGIGEQTLLRVVKHHVSKERRRHGKVTLLLGGIAVAALIFALANSDGGGGGHGGAAEADWDVLVDRYRRSIFLCVGATGTRAGIGTGFVIGGDGLLATNAHVGKMMQSNASRFVIQNGTGIRFEVREIRIHPKYDGVNSPDVAFVKFDTKGETFVELPIAGPERLARLRPGQPLGTMGFPGELSYLNVLEDERFTRAEATFKDARIGKITNYAGDATDDYDERRRIQHNASLSGGTSGSPMFDRDGYVVAIHNSGVEVHADGVRTPSASELLYAIRADEITWFREHLGW